MSIFDVIKRNLIDNPEKIELLLETMGCDYVSYEQQGRLITAQLPSEKFDSKNKRAVQVKLNNSLSSAIRNKGDFETSDIFDLISYLHFDKRGQEVSKNLHKSKEFLCEVCELSHLLSRAGQKQIDMSDLDWLLDLKKKRNKSKFLEPNPIIQESVLDQYLAYPSYDWIQEGLSYRTQKFYDIRFCLESKRIIIPMRNKNGELIGVKGRILNDNDDDRKYLYLNPFNNSQELFNLHNAREHILSKNKVFVFEGEKSCMKMYEAGVYNSVAFGSSDITKFQANLLEQMGKDVEIILCYDTDKTPKEIKKYAEVFTSAKVYAILDVGKMLPDKSSPIDLGIDIFRKLESEHCYPIPIESDRKSS